MLKIKSVLKILFVFIIALLSDNNFAAAKQTSNNSLYKGKGAQYVFLFIGDGMGSLQRLVAEKAFKDTEKNNFWMNCLPVRGITNTLNYKEGITDSAAAVTALACGEKTYNGILGLDHKGKVIESIAETARKQGWKIGIVSSVPLNHATPAGLYAHRMKRSMYNEIIQDLAKSNFEYFGGNSLIIKGNRKEALADIEKNGYIMINSPRKMPVLDPNKKYIVHTQIPYAIDSDKNSGLSLADFTRLGLKHIFTQAGKVNGFFMMIEGGKIDWSGHANDAGALIWEMKAFDEAIKVAIDFYKKYPKSTLIVIVGDHETGGLHRSLSGIKPGWTWSRLKEQKHSYVFLNQKLKKYKKEKLSFEKVIDLLKANFQIENFSDPEIKRLHKAWDIYTGKEKNGHKYKSVYGSYNPLILCMQHIFCNRCGLKWTNNSHSELAVPITAIGVGAKIFEGYYENSWVARKLNSIIVPSPDIMLSEISSEQ